MAYVDISHGVSIEFREIPRVSRGIAYKHPRPDGKGECEGYVPLQPEDRDGWTIMQREPLSLQESLECRICGHHGLIRDGKWYPA